MTDDDLLIYAVAGRVSPELRAKMDEKLREAVVLASKRKAAKP